MNKYTSTFDLDELELENLSNEDQECTTGGTMAEFLGWCVGGAICGMKCIANQMGVTNPGQW